MVAAFERSNTLLSIFSYNRPRELSVCLGSIAEMCPDVTVLVVDDRSSDPEVARVVERAGCEKIVGAGAGPGKHGGLYVNMQRAYELAAERGFAFWMSVQDDMQFVRPFDSAVQAEYMSIFAGDASISQIDPRFVKGNGRGLRQTPLRATFEWIDPLWGTYSDVGFFRLDRLRQVGWRFVEAELANRKLAGSLGLYKVSPFTPITMHLPFPNTFRAKQPFHPKFGGRRAGTYRYRSMTPAERLRMDRRPASQPAAYQRFLSVEGFGLLDRLRFRLSADYLKKFK